MGFFLLNVGRPHARFSNIVSKFYTSTQLSGLLLILSNKLITLKCIVTEIKLY